MSHLRPLTVTWSSGGVGMEDNLHSLHTEEAAAFLPCPPTPQRGPGWPGRCPLRPTKAGAPQEPRFGCKPEGRPCSPVSALRSSAAGACGLAFPSSASSLALKILVRSHTSISQSWKAF